LNVLIGVYFGDEGSYEQALKELSAIISFFLFFKEIYKNQKTTSQKDVVFYLTKQINRLWSDCAKLYIFFMITKKIMLNFLVVLQNV
jgi:hypothetical protein